MNPINKCVISIATVLIVVATSACIGATETPIHHDCSVLVKDELNQTVYAANEHQLRIPASTFKVLTSLVALHYLGRDFRFKTEFYLDAHSNLIIKGYGDPLLISEVISELAPLLCEALKKNTTTINDIILDNSYFDAISIPGVTSSSTEPYDAPNGALCVNFNTVNFHRNAAGEVFSAEPQTPLLPFVVDQIRSTGLSKGRIILNETDSQLYPGHIFKYFIAKNNLPVSGVIRTGISASSDVRLVYTHVSPFSMESMISKLLEYSNNFIANQLFIRCGVKAFGAPGTLEKGIAAASKYSTTVLGLKRVVIDEGSGLSRKNRINTLEMDTILKEFYPRQSLMRQRNHEWYKTGTLTGISTRVGYFTIPSTGKHYRYTVFCSTPGINAESIIDRIIQDLSHIR